MLLLISHKVVVVLSVCKIRPNRLEQRPKPNKREELRKPFVGIIAVRPLAEP